MARGAGALKGAGIAVAVVLVLLTLGTLIAVLLRGGGAALGPADWAAVRFTVTQAAVSAVLSVALAVPVARALARRRFPGRGLLISAMGAPFLLPVIVAVLGLLAVFGRSGLFNQVLGAAGVAPLSIYGFHGVVLAHVFLNLPLAVRLILSGWQGIPSERFRLASSLGMGSGAVLRHLELPMLRAVLPGALLAVFLICLTSFAIALTLGGGPRATTVELAIYQALRFEFDPSHAALLAAIQFALCGGAVLLAGTVSTQAGFGAGLDRPVERWDARTTGLRSQDALVITGAALFLMVPLGLIVERGMMQMAGLPSAVWMAALRSILVAIASTVICMLAVLVLAVQIVQGARWMEIAGMLPLAASSLVLGTGLFVLVHPFIAPERLALPVTAVVNAAMALPFALRIVLPALRDIEATQGRLADSLGLDGWSRLRWLILPRLRPALAFGAGVVAALSMGDLGVIALFAGDSEATLPLLVQRLMGAYRMDEAAAAAMLLVVLSFGIFWLLDRGGRHAAL
jgi:thiamine transport system permease protein